MSDNILLNSSDSNSFLQLRGTASSGANHFIGILSNHMFFRQGGNTGDFKFQDNNTTDKCIINGTNGNITNTNNSYGAISSEKIKENIEEARDYSEDLMKLELKKYNIIGTDYPQLGLMAEEVEKIFPNLVDESEITFNNEKQNLKSIKYSVLNLMMLKTIQEIKKKLDKWSVCEKCHCVIDKEFLEEHNYDEK